MTRSLWSRALALFVGLSGMRTRARPPGEVTLAFVGLYGLGRTVIEVFRADTERGLYLGGLVSTSQIVGVGTALIAFAWLAARRRTGS